jgi:hypothetical protein
MSYHNHSNHHRNDSLFCGGCWNYLDNCDCDITMTDPDEIPWEFKTDTPSTNEVRNWYFLLPLEDLPPEIPQWMIAQMLQEPSLWTQQIPPDLGYLMSATVIPVDAIPVNPWELNFFTSSIDIENDTWEEHVTKALGALSQMAGKCAGQSGAALAACMVTSLVTSYLPAIAGIIDDSVDDFIDWNIPTEIPPYDVSWVAKVPGTGPGAPLVITAAALYFVNNMDPRVINFLDNQLISSGPDHFWLERPFDKPLYPQLGATVTDLWGPAMNQSIEYLTDGTYFFSPILTLII